MIKHTAKEHKTRQHKKREIAFKMCMRYSDTEDCWSCRNGGARQKKSSLHDEDIHTVTHRDKLWIVSLLISGLFNLWRSFCLNTNKWIFDNRYHSYHEYLRDDIIIHVATTNVIMTLTFLPTHPPQLTPCRGTSFSLSYISFRQIFIQSGCAVTLPEQYQDSSGCSE